MKCVHCDTDTNYRDRRASGGRCRACSHLFAFEPKTDPHTVADGLFKRAIKEVSGGDALFFTEHQLWYEFNRRLLARKTVGCGGSAAAAGLLLAAATAYSLPRVGPLVLGGGAAALALAATAGDGKEAGAARPRRAAKPRYTKITFDDWRTRYLDRWRAVHGAPAKLLPPAPRAPAADANTVPDDVSAYSFDRALVADRAETAHLLVANNFHFENNCAILSADGYPENVFATVMTMLRRNPALFVFALHDADAAGIGLAGRLRTGDWFPDPTTARVLDLGLRPRHALQTNLLVTRRPRRVLLPDERSGLEADEIAWLENGSVGELAALRPARLMRAVYQGFARAREIGPDGYSGGGGVIWISDGVGGGTADVYAADSFG